MKVIFKIIYWVFRIIFEIILWLSVGVIIGLVEVFLGRNGDNIEKKLDKIIEKL